MLGLAVSAAKGGAALLTYVKDNLKLYLNFTSNKSDTLKFPCEGSTDFVSGSSQYIDCGNSASLQITGKTITVSAWFKLDGDTDWDKIVANSDGGSYEDGFTLFYENELLHFSINHYSTNVATTAFTDYGAWHHVVGVYDGTLATANIKIYLDGVLGTTTDDYTTDIGNTRSTYIGAGYNGSVTDFFDGKIANVGIWDRALSLEEVNSVMRKNYSQLKTIEKTSLVSWWALDSSSSTELIQDEHNAEALGIDLVDANTNSSWTAWGSNTIGNVTGGVSVTYAVSGGNNKGAIGYLTDAKLLSTDLTNGKLYKLTFNAYYSGGSSGSYMRIIDVTPTKNFDVLTTTSTAHTHYFIMGSSSPYLQMGSVGASNIVYITDVVVKEVTSNTGRSIGATTTTSVYGGNAPVLPRSVDVARQGEAEAIGDGSASFTVGDEDYIQIQDTGIVLHDWTVSFWMKTISNTTAYPGFVATYSSTNNDYDNGMTINYFDDYVDIEGASAFGHFPKVAGNTNLDDNQWRHIAVTCDRDGSTGGLKQYINGILIDSNTSVDAVTNADKILFGARFYSTSLSNWLNGSMSQVGMWQGILTQAQIQSVMESTSYATIPASVKSTLGSELFADSWTAVNATTEESTDYVFSGTTSRKFTTTSADGYIRGTSGMAATSGKLYKVSVMVYSPSDTDIKVHVIQGNSSGWNLYETVTITAGVWVNITRYIVENSGGGGTNIYLRQGTDGVTQYVDDFSFKEVTNDLVGYWALDADNSIDVLSFGGDGDHINCGSDTSLALATDFTISVWFNSSDVTGYERLVSRGQYNAGFIFGLNDDNLDFTFKDADDASHTARAGATNMTANLWYHGVAVSNSSTGKVHVYLNGVDDGNSSITHPIQTPSADFRIGSEGTNHFNGKIAQVAVYNTALSASQILTQYNLGVDGDYSSDDNLIGYWKLNTEGTVTDLGSGGNNGTATGTTLVENAVALDSTSNNNNGDLL